MTGGRASRFGVALALAVALLVLAPLFGAGAGCGLGARELAERYQQPIGRTIPSPAPLAWGSALLGADAQLGGAVGSGVGYAIGLVALVLVARADRRDRERRGEPPRSLLVPVVLSALIGCAVLLMIGLALARKARAPGSMAARAAPAAMADVTLARTQPPRRARA